MSENSNSKQWRKIMLLVVGAVVGIALIVYGAGVGTSDKEDTSADSEQYSDADLYAKMLEERVAEICSGVSGAGSVRVFVSLKGGYRTVYAVDAQSSSSGYKSQIVMSGSGSDKRAVVSAYENPEIAGVGIVCDGADNAEVRAEIISLVAAALNISTNKIFVAK